MFEQIPTSNENSNEQVGEKESIVKIERKEETKISYSDFTKLIRLKGSFEAVDKYEFGVLIEQLKKSEVNDPTINSKLTSLVEKYRNANTSSCKKIQESDLYSEEYKSSKFLNRNTVLALKQQWPEAEFYEFENKVGNWKPVLMIEINGRGFIVKKIDDEYLLEYNKIKNEECRPDVIVEKIEGQTYGLFEFMGSETVDYTNLDHLGQVVDLALASTKRKTTFDPNPGNLVIKEGKLNYIDVGLNYASRENLTDALLQNIYHTIENIPYAQNFKKEYLGTTLGVIMDFKQKITNYINDNQTGELLRFEDNSLFEEKINERFYHIFRILDKEDSELIKREIKKIFE